MQKVLMYFLSILMAAQQWFRFTIESWVRGCLGAVHIKGLTMEARWFLSVQGKTRRPALGGSRRSDDEMGEINAPLSGARPPGKPLRSPSSLLFVASVPSRYATLLMPRIQTPYEVCHYKLFMWIALRKILNDIQISVEEYEKLRK